MKKKVGANITNAIYKRIKTIKAFPSFSKLLHSKIGRIEALKGEFKGLFSMRITANFRMILKPKVERINIEDLEKCNTVIILGVIDYHGRTNKNNWIIP